MANSRSFHHQREQQNVPSPLRYRSQLQTVIPATRHFPLFSVKNADACHKHHQERERNWLFRLILPTTGIPHQVNQIIPCNQRRSACFITKVRDLTLGKYRLRIPILPMPVLTLFYT